MFGLFKQPQFEDHLKRLEKLLWAAQEKMLDADEYLLGTKGIGSDNVKMMSANGAIGKCIAKLKEAMWLAEQAIKASNGDHQKLDLILNVVETSSFAEEQKEDYDGGYHFYSEETKRRWKEGFCETWMNQFNEMLPSNYSRRAKAN
jgi:hypothetical protein